MPLVPPIFLAASEGIGIDVIVWLVAGAIWVFGQMAAAKKRKNKKARQAQQHPASPSAGARSGSGEAPTPDELSEIFKRLGGDIPATPPPAPPRPRPTPRPATTVAAASRETRKPAYRPVLRKAAAPVAPVLAQRLARAKQEATAAARDAEAARIATNAIVHGVQSRTGENRAFDTATQHTGMILPRLYAMNLRLATWPMMPMPAFDHSQNTGTPFRPRLHTRQEIRDALIAQALLQPSKGSPR